MTFIIGYLHNVDMFLCIVIDPKAETWRKKLTSIAQSSVKLKS